MLPEAGSYKRIIFPAIKTMPVWLYHPSNVTSCDRVIVAVHGISRHYLHQIEAYKELAETYGCWLLVPEFNKKAFPRYQQLAKDVTCPRADLALNTALLAWKNIQKQPNLKIHLCGYSGGAQFAHRYAMAHPQHVESLVLCSAGWYTFPDPREEYPYGTASWPVWLAPSQVDEMIKLPILVMVGENDIEREKNLRQSKALDQQQGMNRLERAQRWSDAVSEYKREKSVPNGIRFHRLPGQAHSFECCAKESDMMQHIADFWHEMEWRQECVA